MLGLPLGILDFVLVVSGLSRPRPDRHASRDPDPRRDELELRFGRGPFLSATRVEAALLALESSGLVTAHADGRRITYTPAVGSAGAAAT